jgi:O-antigen ligase
METNVRGQRDTHSTYLRIAAETGFPGLMIYFAMWGSVFWKVRTVRRTVRYVRPKDYQFLFYLELAMVAFSVAAIFGTYGALSFTYLSIAVAWLCAITFERDTWYVGKAAAVQAGAPVPAIQRSR